MVIVNISYNGNKDNEFYILPEAKGTSEKFVNGVGGCISYIKEFPYPIQLEFSKNPEENKFRSDDRRELADLVLMHNQREHIISQIKKIEPSSFTPQK